jgi:hypothetical protein
MTAVRGYRQAAAKAPKFARDFNWGTAMKSLKVNVRAHNGSCTRMIRSYHIAVWSYGREVP